MLNRFLLLAFASITLCLPVYAQSNYYEETSKVFSGGLIAGANFTQVDGDNFYGYHKVGLTAGGVVYIRFNENFGASMELYYSQKGSRGEVVTNSQSLGIYVQKYFMNLNYVEVPITIHVKSYFKSHLIYFEGGLSYAYLIKSSEYIQADQPVVIDPVLNRFNNTDFNYILGLCVNLYKKWYADARFQYSIFEIRPSDREPLGYGYGNSGQFNNMFSLRFMYLF